MFNEPGYVHHEVLVLNRNDRTVVENFGKNLSKSEIADLLEMIEVDQMLEVEVTRKNSWGKFETSIRRVCWQQGHLVPVLRHGRQVHNRVVFGFEIDQLAGYAAGLGQIVKITKKIGRRRIEDFEYRTF